MRCPIQVDIACIVISFHPRISKAGDDSECRRLDAETELSVPGEDRAVGGNVSTQTIKMGEQG